MCVCDADAEVRDAFAYPTGKEALPYSRRSTQRIDYRNPKQQPEHVLSVDRYSCNRNKQFFASGGGQCSFVCLFVSLLNV